MKLTAKQLERMIREEIDKAIIDEGALQQGLKKTKHWLQRRFRGFDDEAVSAQRAREAAGARAAKQSAAEGAWMQNNMRTKYGDFDKDFEAWKWWATQQGHQLTDTPVHFRPGRGELANMRPNEQLEMYNDLRTRVNGGNPLIAVNDMEMMQHVRLGGRTPVLPGEALRR
jgi:hypothetical protein